MVEDKYPDELFDEMEEESKKITEEQLVEQGLKIIERTVIDYRERGYTVYLYTLEDTEPLVASSRLDKIDEIKLALEEWIPVKARFAVKSRLIGIDGMKEEIIESRIRAIVDVQRITDFRLPWQKVVVSRRNRIYIRRKTDIIFFEETENAIVLEDYMKSKGLVTMEMIALIGGNKKIEELDEMSQIKGIYWLTREMWKALKERLGIERKKEQKEEAKEPETEETVTSQELQELPETVEV